MQSDLERNLAVPSATEWRTWSQLQLRYKEGNDMWTERELNRLRFLRWLVQTGQLGEDDRSAATSSGTSGQ